MANTCLIIGFDHCPFKMINLMSQEMVTSPMKKVQNKQNSSDPRICSSQQDNTVLNVCNAEAFKSHMNHRKSNYHCIGIQVNANHLI